MDADSKLDKLDICGHAYSLLTSATNFFNSLKGFILQTFSNISFNLIVCHLQHKPLMSISQDLTIGYGHDLSHWMLKDISCHQ